MEQKLLQCFVIVSMSPSLPIEVIVNVGRSVGVQNGSVLRCDAGWHGKDLNWTHLFVSSWRHRSTHQQNCSRTVGFLILTSSKSLKLSEKNTLLRVPGTPCRPWDAAFNIMSLFNLISPLAENDLLPNKTRVKTFRGAQCGSVLISFTLYWLLFDGQHGDLDTT